MAKADRTHQGIAMVYILSSNSSNFFLQIPWQKVPVYLLGFPPPRALAIARLCTIGLYSRVS